MPPAATESGYTGAVVPMPTDPPLLIVRSEETASVCVVMVDAPRSEGNAVLTVMVLMSSEEKIIVRDRSAIALCEGCLRISVGSPEENASLMEAFDQLI